ncbi:MAG: site-specific DNA-methyltransferase [Elusimicrobiota bacterium]|nr:site-specific DNA-methyltransferase [Endomicrobiia bacterium]MDW8165978.1 site-specific DNA-methyltransferase [Elusimicrobiota bacterium]
MNILEKFQNLLENIFQFEASDLDFGIYRILNYKRVQIQKFIKEDLLEKVEEAFSKHKDERLININQKFEEIKEKIIQNFGKDAFTPLGDIKEEFKNTPLGKNFYDIKLQKEEVEKIDEIKLQVFNDLYNFFSRYYEEGDFIPQYRYSIKGHKYAIPYNGEEVTLYWVNKDQYYIKTGILFRDYTFKADDYRIVFRTVEAKEELGSNKATRERFFVLDEENMVEIDDKSRNIVIRFQYRELKEEEIKKYQVEGGSNTSKQEKINQVTYDEVISEIKDIYIKGALSKVIKNDNPLLLYHLNRFTAKNTKDYFIHKNLKKFLSEQLDYFIKSEVLSIETLEQERFLDKHITRAKVVKEIGEAIIDFLSQIEDFQKRLWEKKKFVIQTHYVITLDKIKDYAGEEFLREILPEILDNKDQLKEWEELGFGKIEGEKDIFVDENLISKEYKKLPIDTRYFSQEFKEKLIEKLTENYDLDDLLDGILIKSENWQALNLLLNKYKEKVQTIYIDPPFNKEQDADYLYNVKYKNSTWASMLENRLRLARDLLNDRGSIFVRCDYNGNWIVRPLMNEIFGEDNFRNEIVVRRGEYPKGEVNRYRTGNDNIFFYTKSIKSLFFTSKKERTERKWFSMHLAGERESPELQVREFFGVKLLPPKGRHWMISQEKIDELIKKNEIRINKNKTYIDLQGNIVKGEPEMLQAEFEILDSNWMDIQSYSTNWGFKTENSEILLKRVIESTSNEGNLVMDFFLGSGTTTAVAHKLKRKWIGVEMGDHFWTVILPRMKKVLFYDKSGISREKDVKEKYNEKTAGGFFKYHYLEQYEDTLDNIELKENKKTLELLKDEYLLKYFLELETKESPYLLNIDQLKNPFLYKLKVNLSEVGEPQEMIVDIPETFNYLIGLKVRKIKTRNNNGIKYLFILGEKEGKNISIVWREYSENWKEEDFMNDKEFILHELQSWSPRIVYVNGQSVLTPKDFEIRYIEPEFKKLMEG